MFTTLIESRGTRKRDTPWLLASAALHLMLLAGLMASSPKAHSRESAPAERAPLVWVAPRAIDPGGTQPAAGSSGSGAAFPASRRIPSLDGAPFVDVPDILLAGSGAEATIEAGLSPTTDFRGASGSGGPFPGGGGEPLSAAQVERAALPHAGNRPPEYPRQLHAAGIEGSVLMRFVIDTTGEVERGSPVVIRSDHPLLTTAVMRALATHRFLPAEAGGRRVRMLVEQRFEFEITSAIP